MNTRIFFLLLFITAMGCSGSKDTSRASDQPALTKATSTDTESLLSYQDEITTDFLRSHLTVFSADSMEGRETAMPGQKKAAKYLTDQYAKLGLKPVGDNNSYLQKFGLTAERTDSVIFKTYAINEDGTKDVISKSVNSKSTSANYIRRFGGDNTVEGEIIFAGYGLQNEELGINNFKGVDIEGKWVMVFDDLPQVVEGDTLFTDRSRFSQTWVRNILQKGVAGILMIPENMKEFDTNSKAGRSDFGKPSGMQLAYRAQESGRPAWSFNTIKPGQAAKILGLSGVDALNQKKEELIKDIKDFTASETGYGLTQIPYMKQVMLESENIAALMEGADPQLKDEVVVLSAHYDHVGIGAPDSTGDAIYNGANDDGSGTIGVLAAARAFAKAKENGVQPRRSILFLSVSGEEKGLLGSRYYSDHPIYPIEKTVANINTDMIGRVDPKHRESGNSDYIYIIGADIISSDMDSLLKAGNTRSGQLELDMRYNDLNDPNRFYRRSDHWNFGRFGIPFVFFFNGVHEDYHRPSDEVDKINFNLMAKTVRSMYATTVMVANADSMPKVDNQEFIEITKEN
jgi:Zn-dependent M28 family amino/carboxypeptidase